LSPLARLVVLLIVGYRRFVSPVLGENCRYLPSCSEYARMAIEEWGLLRGGTLGIARILRCHPWSATGLDLPPRKGAQRTAASIGRGGD
jgi:putative membrane protein insertion efficiency factor